MDIRLATASEIPAAIEMLVSNGWNKRLSNMQKFMGLVAASQVTAVAAMKGQVVGLIRAITDGLSNGYLSMLVVAPDWRKQGIGRVCNARAYRDFAGQMGISR